jgi:regulatory protein
VDDLTSLCPSDDAPQASGDMKAKELTLRRRAMDYLARREHSRFELRNKLSEKAAEFDAALIDLVLDRLVADGLLSDGRFAESYVRSRINRGYGPVYIRYQLRQRKVEAELIDEMLDCDDLVWLHRLEDLIIRKSGLTTLPPKGSPAWQKLQRFILSRGFTTQQFLHLTRGAP